MWVVYSNGQAIYWLLAGEVYTLGKKGCHIAINDDASISRRHLTLEVGVSHASGQQQQQQQEEGYLILTDTSSYGTEVCSSSAAGSDKSGDVSTRELQLCRSTALRQELAKGEPFRVSSGDPAWREFSILVGAHGATLQLRWEPMHVFIVDIAEEQRTKLECCLSRCAAVVVADFHKVDYLVTSRLRITPVAIAMLCRGVNIVSPMYFEAICDRCISNPQLPLPEPLAYPPVLDNFWAMLWGADAEVMSWLQGRLLFPPNRKDRQQLFSNLTFVTVQRSLYEEVQSFLPCASGRVTLDESLLDANNEERLERLLSHFYSQHRHHVVLYNSRELLPFRHCMRTLQKLLRLSCVEYLDLIKSIAHVTPLTLSPFPQEPTLQHLRAADDDDDDDDDDDVLQGRGGDDDHEKEEEEMVERRNAAEAEAAKAREKQQRAPGSPVGRRTDPNPLFRESPSDVEMEQQEESESGRRHPIKRAAEVDGWVTRELTSAPDAEDLVVAGLPALPLFPCFQSYNTSAASDTISLGSKRFRKQLLVASGENVELDRLADAPARVVLSRTHAIDADDIIPDVVVEPTQINGSRFNAYDATAQQYHRPHTRAAAVKRDAPSVAPLTKTRQQTTTARAAKAAVQCENNTAGLAPNVVTRNKRGGAPVNIFDMEALF